MNNRTEPILYIVIPCYNEEQVLPITAVMFLISLVMLVINFKIVGTPLNGSLAVILAGTLLFILSYQSISVLIVSLLAAPLFFLLAGSFSFTLGTRMLPKLRGIVKKYPISGVGFGVAALAIAGVPPMNTFFSKFQIIAGGFSVGAGNVAILVLVCIMVAETVATRKASQKALNALAPALPELLGGSADLTGSNLTNWTGVKSLNSGDFLARHISYGVREFGMSAIMNGIALYGGFIPYAATFLTFSDYSRNALRMSSLMKQRVINVFTHDSIGLGEDGPTHQSVEHVPSLRLIPGMHVWRPADTVETIIAWASAIERRNGPSCLVFTRQNVPFLDRDEVDADAIARGAYVAAEAPAGAGEAEVVLLATGSEVGLAMKARAELTARNVQVRVVSMPCANLFDEQDEEYRRAVLPEGVPVLAIEASKSDLWYKYFSGKGAVIGVDTFGESAPACVLWERFGFTVENVVAKVEQLLK